MNEEAILRKTRLVSRVMTEFKGSAPTVGVCALNPHAGEEGLFGDEEQTHHSAGRRARPWPKDSMLDGPLPADTLIGRARDGEFDAVVAMYHDQGHIAIKLLAMHRAVNVTLGLPIVRTSVAHGTAFDLAWQGRAETCRHGRSAARRQPACAAAACATAATRSAQIDSATYSSTPQRRRLFAPTGRSTSSSPSRSRKARGAVDRLRPAVGPKDELPRHRSPRRSALRTTPSAPAASGRALLLASLPAGALRQYSIR